MSIALIVKGLNSHHVYFTTISWLEISRSKSLRGPYQLLAGAPDTTYRLITTYPAQLQRTYMYRS
jgi:hypothetical protein